MRQVKPVRLVIVGLFALFLFNWSLPATAQTPTEKQPEATPLEKVPMNRPEKGMVFDGLVAAKTGPCVGMFQVGKTDTCTHGPDEAAPGVNVFRPVDAVDQKMAPASVICDGDGVSGKRTQVMYVRASDRADRYASYLASFRTWASDMDNIYNASAQETGGTRHVRLVTDSGCNVSVLNIVVGTAADDSFDATINAVKALGYTSANRKYLMFVDANVYCGIGGIQNDDRKIATNLNDTTVSYARVDSGCWGGSVAAHENMHNIGGVQLSAPHTSRGWHCVDEYDRMCYSDSPNYPAMQYFCTSQSHDNLFDCNHDDYYHTNPPAGNYLATHWNSADSAFLVGGTTTTPPSTPTNFRVTSVSAGRVNLGWTDTSNETSYVVQKWQYINSQWVWADWATLAANTTGVGNTGLACNTTYYYRIIAKNAAGASAPSAWVSGTTPACLAGSPDSVTDGAPKSRPAPPADAKN
jgi:hypothetical protein